MKTSITLFTLLVTITILIVQSFNQQGFSNISGAPSARAGSPFEGGFTCNLSGCHNSFPTGQRPGWITSNVPGTGYIAGQTYTVTATAVSAGCTRFGFEITAQTSTGATAGTAIITNPSQTKLVSPPNTRWVTHTQAGTSVTVSGTKTWTYNWTAPAAGTGTVTFYGAFNRSNASNTVFGDSIFTSTMVVPESTVGMAEAEENISFSVYPVPADENIFVQLKVNTHSIPEVWLTDISGKIILKASDAVSTRGLEYTFSLNSVDIEPGIYFIRIINDASVAVKKIIVL